MKFASLLIFVLILLSGCEKTVNFKLDEVPPKLVVEATIENNQYPLVFLSRSLGYFSSIDSATLANSFVHGAIISISNGTLTHILKEYPVDLGSNYTVYFYSIDSTQMGTAFKGVVNGDYSLRIESQGEIFTSSTHIPYITRRIDSLFWKEAPPNVGNNKVSLMLRATDRTGYGDYVRYFTKRNSELFYPGLNSVFDDQVIDGETYEIPVERGIDRNAGRSENFEFFDKGDTVTLKLSNIDRATFDFWRTMEFTYTSVGNPFSSPTKVISNISGNALGYFGGYGSQYKTILIPK